MTLALTAALIGTILAGSIFYLVRRDHLYGPQTFFWLMIATAAMVAGFVPGAVDRLGGIFSVAYPPMLWAVFALVAIFIKLLLTDIEMARKERRLRRLTQKIALLEYELRQSRPSQGAVAGHDDASAATPPGKRQATG